MKNTTNVSVTKKSRADSLMLRFIISYSIFLLIILVMLALIFNVYIKNSAGKYNLSQRATYVSKIELFERNFDIMDATCRQLLQDNNFRRVMNTSSFNSDGLELGNALSDELAVNLYADALLPLKEMYFYMRSSGYILNSSYFITADQFYSWIQKYPAVLNDAWLNILNDENSYHSFIPLNDYKYSGDKYYMYIIDMDKLTYLPCNVSAVFVISKEELINLLGFSYDQLQENDMLVFDPSAGKTILSLDDNGTFSDTDVTSLHYIDDFSSIKLNGRDISLLRYTSPATGYEYYISFPAYRIVSVPIIILSILGVVSAFLGVALIIVISRNNVAPIIQMGEELDISNDEKEKLKTLVDAQQPIVNRTYVRQLLLSGVSSEAEGIRIKTHLGIEGSNYFKAMQVVIYNSSSDEMSTESSYLSDEIMSLVVDHISESLGKPLHYFFSGDHSFAVLLDFDESEHPDYLLKVQNAILKIHNELQENHNLWLFAGIGKTTQSLLNVWESYEQAATAVTYTSKNYIFLPYEYIKKDSTSFYYPQEFSNKLVYFVTNGNEAQAMDLLRLIRKENLEERSLSTTLMNFLLTDIRNSLLKARFELPSSLSDEETKPIDDRFAATISFTALEDITVSLCKLFAAGTGDGNLIDTIIVYIKANYADSLLCLNKIADEFNISETYFSHLFKDKTGVNFSTYLENLRMTKAMELIKSGEIPLGEVYEAVGYNNSNSFRRAFKKVYGITPGSVKTE